MTPLDLNSLLLKLRNVREDMDSESLSGKTELDAAIEQVEAAIEKMKPGPWFKVSWMMDITADDHVHAAKAAFGYLMSKDGSYRRYFGVQDVGDGTDKSQKVLLVDVLNNKIVKE